VIKLIPKTIQVKEKKIQVNQLKAFGSLNSLLQYPWRILILHYDRYSMRQKNMPLPEFGKSVLTLDTRCGTETKPGKLFANLCMVSSHRCPGPVRQVSSFHFLAVDFLTFGPSH